MTTAEKTELLRAIKDEVINLKKSPLYAHRMKEKNLPVIGEGDHEAEIMFVGEAPGRNEAKTGRPFCGAAGKILDELLESAGIKREKVYITNIVKDRPPFNRDPLPEEIKIYAPFLNRQIEIIQPKIIATLGRFSMQYIMENFGLKNELGPISKLHGKMFKTKIFYSSLDKGTLKDCCLSPNASLLDKQGGPGGVSSDIQVAVLYHPAVAVYNAKMKDELKKDFAILK